VVDPDAPGRYLVGIECDGANYHRAKTARDRDKLRESILRDLGWELRRIWSTVWWTNPAEEVRKLEAVLIHAVARRRDQPTSKMPAPPAEDVAQIVETSTSAASPESLAPQSATSFESNFPVYVPYPVTRLLGTQEEFYQYVSSHRIREVIAEVVKHEGSISLWLAARRVATHWGFKQVREQARERVRNLIPREEVQAHASGTDIFLWPAGTDPETYQNFRVPSVSPDSVRDADDLPVEEMACAALFILRQHISVPEADLVRETGRLFGFQRSGERIERRMLAGIEILIQSGAQPDATIRRLRCGPANIKPFP
jgi:hypothetical protein